MENFKHLEIHVHSFRDSCKKIKRNREFRTKNGYDFNITGIQIFTDNLNIPVISNYTECKPGYEMGISSWNKELDLILESLIMFVTNFKSDFIQIYTSERQFNKYVDRFNRLIQFIQTEDFELLYKESTIEEITDIVCFEEFIFDKRNNSFNLVYSKLPRLISSIYHNKHRFLIKSEVYKPIKLHKNDIRWKNNWKFATDIRNRVINHGQLLVNLSIEDTHREVTLRKYLKKQKYFPS